MKKKIIEKLNNSDLKTPYILVNLAEEIYALQKKLPAEAYSELIQIFDKKLKESNNQDVLDYYIDYIIRIIEVDMIYEEMIKVQSLCEQCYILYQLGCRTNRDLSSFYYNLKKVVNRNSKIFKEIDNRFRSEHINQPLWGSKFLGES